MGDTAYCPIFGQIGERYGPFDLGKPFDRQLGVVQGCCSCERLDGPSGAKLAQYLWRQTALTTDLNVRGGTSIHVKPDLEMQRDCCMYDTALERME